MAFSLITRGLTAAVLSEQIGQPKTPESGCLSYLKICCGLHLEKWYGGMEIQVTGLTVTPGSGLVLRALCDAVHSSRNRSAFLQLPALSLTRSISETRLPGSDLTGDSHLAMVR